MMWAEPPEAQHHIRLDEQPQCPPLREPTKLSEEDLVICHLQEYAADIPPQWGGIITSCTVTTADNPRIKKSSSGKLAKPEALVEVCGTTEDNKQYLSSPACHMSA